MENILTTSPTVDYDLIDSGEGEKLERFGRIVLRRPDPQAIWKKTLDQSHWDKCDAVFRKEGNSAKWKVLTEFGKDWQVTLGDSVFKLQLLPSKHLGIFPEQLSHWQWLESKISESLKAGKKVSVLNLFGYTGGATLACARGGAEVCHVDASKFAVDLAHMNLDSSKLSDKKVRFIVDDVRKFVEREIKRGNKYDVILMDPPVYGKGAKDEVWKIEEDLLPLVARLKNILSSEPLAVILNGYSSVYSSVTYSQVLNSLTENLGGETAFGELAIKESAGGRLLPAGIFAKWSK